MFSLPAEHLSYFIYVTSLIELDIEVRDEDSPNDVQWLHWMALILVTTVHAGSSAFFKPADSIATANGNLRRNVTVFLLLLRILTYVSKLIE
jgi:hypothetical protein